MFQPWMWCIVLPVACKESSCQVNKCKFKEEEIDLSKETQHTEDRERIWVKHSSTYHLYRIMKHFYPDGSGLFQEVSAPIHRTRRVTDWFEEYENYELWTTTWTTLSSKGRSGLKPYQSFNASPICTCTGLLKCLIQGKRI